MDTHVTEKRGRGMARRAALGTAIVLPLLAAVLVALGSSSTAQPAAAEATAAAAGSYPVVDTGQTACYNNLTEIDCPTVGAAFYGQDAQMAGNQPSYTDNGDGTVTSNVTGLMWQQSPDTDGDGVIDAADKLTYADALAGAAGFDLAGYTDWRLPTIKELYSLIDFRGVDPSGFNGSTAGLIPFIDTSVFAFGYGDTAAGERIIDAQFATSTKYVSTTMGGNDTMFGVNFADGRIKGYPTGPMPGQSGGKTFYVLYVRGNTSYGVNDFTDNGNGTITDRATGLMWAQEDSGAGLNWEQALAWVEQMNAENYLGHSDWRLPNAKELQSIVDYSRAPDATNSAAIDPLFDATAITNEAGQVDYPSYWTSTTHVNGSSAAGSYGVYIAFGRAMGYMNGRWIDVHGAGAQRSDPKAGDPADWPTGHGPQGDAIRITNFVRLVRDVDASAATPTASATEAPSATVTSAAPPAPTATATPASVRQSHKLYLPMVLEKGSGPARPAFTIDQTLSDGAQRNTIAFDALAFLTGNLGVDSFFPPGKVADFWGFQYLRDNDPSEVGHNTDFLFD